MVYKNRGIYGFLGPSWVLITYNICPPVIAQIRGLSFLEDLDRTRYTVPVLYSGVRNRGTGPA